jgi:excisionase family DNA binding protein
MNDRLFKKQDLADYLQVSIGKVDLMMKNGLPFIKDGANVRFIKNQVDEYLYSKTTTV